MNTKIAEKVFRVLIIFAFLLGTTWMPGIIAGAQEPNPTFSANLTENGISDLWNWQDGALLSLTIDHPGTPQSPDYTETKIYDPVNRTHFNLEEFILKIGDLVTVTDGYTTKSTIVANVSITEINLDNETISGTADPFTNVRVNVWAAGLSRLVQADANGNWLADFSEEYDIHAGDNGRVTIEDSDGDRTGEYWHVNYTLTRIEAYPDIDRIGGGQWPLGATVTIEIDDPVTPQNPDYIDNVMVGMTEDPFQTWFDMDINGYDLKTGDVITATDGTTIKQLIVGNLMITAVDLDADMVYGVAEPNQTGDVFVGNRQGGSRYLTADQEGNWSANFAVPGDWDGEWEIVDLRPGSRIISSFYDEDTDATVYERTAGSTIYGTVYLIESAPENVMAGVLIEACTSDNFCRTDLTNGSGNYRLDGLAAGTYTIRAIPPGTNLPGNLGPIDISDDEILHGQDVIVPEPPLPPPPDAVEPAHPGGGTIVVYDMDNLTLTAYGCINGTASFELTVLDDGYTVDGSMTETPTGSGTYIATIPPLHPHHGVAEIVYTITCPDGSTVETPFFIYIDPSGVVKNTNGEPIPDATVTLYYADASDGPFTEVPDGSVLMSPSNRKNPDTTNASGQFGWDVVAGFYKVRAEKDGCFSPTDPLQTFVESAVLTIPPPVTDLELILECPAPFPTTPILDNFDRPNGSLGSNWLGSKGAYRIANNQVDVRKDGPIYWKDTFGVSQEAYVTLTTVDPKGGEQDLLLKVQDVYGPNWGDGVIEVLYSARRNSVTVWTFRPDTLRWFKYPAIPVSFANGDQFGAQALASGDVVVIKNGEEIGRVTMNAADQSFFNPRGGNIGLWFIGARNAFFDDFGGGDITNP